VPAGSRSLLLLHGPNLNLLGEREPETYGAATLDEFVDVVRIACAAEGIEVEAAQSNAEGDLVDHIHRARGVHRAIIVNPGALTHYAWSLHDAFAAFDGVVIEVHISNPNAREPTARSSGSGCSATNWRCRRSSRCSVPATGDRDVVSCGERAYRGAPCLPSPRTT
jgi:3-dehydroquinate dehydratase